MGGLSKQRFPTPEEEEEEEGRFHDPIHHPTASSSSLFLSRPTSNPLRVFARRRESHGARSPPLLILGNWIQPSPPPCACACVFVERPWNRVIGPPRLSSSAVTSPLRKPRLHLPHSQTNTRRTPSPRPDRRSSWHGGARNTRLRVWLRFPLPLVAHLHSVALSHSPVLIVAIARAPVHLSISLALMGQRERRRNFVILERKVRELSCSK